MRKSKWVIVTLMVGLVVAFSGLVPASAQSTTKKLSSNFTLVNLDTGSNTATIAYYKPDGSKWRTTDQEKTLDGLGDNFQYRQYTDSELSAGRGSVVVTSDGPLGAVVQIQARDGQTPSFGAYTGVSDGASSVGIPVVLRKRSTASGQANSQIIVQNAGSANVNIAIDLISSSTGTTTFTHTPAAAIAPNAAYEYDLQKESSTNIPDEFVGSAVVRVVGSGEVAVVANLFSGADSMQTFNGFPQTAGAASADSAQTWYIPHFFSRLDNNLSTVVAVQNVSGGEIGVGKIVMTCKPDRAGLTDQVWTNTTAVKNTASFEFNPVPRGANDANWTLYPKAWRGSCIVTTTGFATNTFVQMRIVNPDNAVDPNSQAAGAYSAFSGGDDIVVIPIFAKRLPNGFASSIAIQNLDPTNVATVKLEFTASPETPRAECSVTKDNVTIQPGQNISLNLRLPNATPPIADSFPEMADNCQGSLVVTSKNGQPINGYVQLTIVTDMNPALATGDTFQAHNGFTISN